LGRWPKSLEVDSKGRVIGAATRSRANLEIGLMVVFALRRGAALEALAIARQIGCAVWVGSDAVTDSEFERYGSEGVKVSRFIYPLSKATAEVIEDALETIALHHPGETIWVQHCRVLHPTGD
jgi:hypothetical protein